MYPGSETPGGIPLIKVGDIKDGAIIGRPTFCISPETNHEYRRTQLQGDELLVTLVGNPGECVVVQPHMAGWNPARAIAVMRLSDPTLRTYLKTVLESSAGKHLIDAVLNTTVQKTLNLKEIKRLPIPLPPLPAIEGITLVAEALSTRIALLRETNATLEAVAQALFKSWFVDFDPVRAKMAGRAPEGMDDATAALFPDALEETELGLAPKGWQVMPLADAFEFNPSRPLKKGVLAPYLDMASVATHGHRTAAPIQRELGSGTKFCNGDTLLARITPCLENGKAAFVDFLADGQIGWGSTEFLVMRPKGSLPDYFAYLLCKHQPFLDFAIQSMVGTSGRQRIQNEALGRYPIAVPPNAVALAFGQVVDTLQSSISANDGQSKTLATLRDTLLPSLISGQVRVPGSQLPCEEVVA
jgi:type I restriction enzyme S subunit